MVRFGRGYPEPVVRSPNNIVFDAVGGGLHVSAASGSWSHTAKAGATVVIGVLCGGSGSAPTFGMTYGGTAMTKLGSAYNWASGLYIQMGILANVAGGTVTVSSSTSTGTSLVGNTVSYLGVRSWGTVQTNKGTSTTPTLTVPSGLNHRPVVYLRGDVAPLTAFTKTARWTDPSGAPNQFLGDAPGTPSTVFSATQASGNWGVNGVDLIP